MALLLTWTTVVALSVADEGELRREYQAFVDGLDAMVVARDHPGAVRELLSADPERQVRGLRTLAATEAVEAIPWLLPFLDHREVRVRVYAALGVCDIVSGQALRRRDREHPERVVLKPLGPEDRDLRPLAWLALDFLGSEDPNVQCYGATMVRYLELRRFTGHLVGLLESRHPAVRGKARFALRELGGGDG